MEKKKVVQRSLDRMDWHRPRYHYLPASNWMNDPNGVIQWQGRYHLFYQYNPYGANHANMHWGHAVSDDLVHWEELSIALAPTPASVDQGGIFSGCVVNDNGIPAAFYTGVNDDYSIQLQCMATGNDDLTLWKKSGANPVIAVVPEAMGQTNDFRDPYVWQEDDGWYMVIGSRINGVGGAILLYRSDNLVDWEYLNPLFIGEAARNGVMFECPNFFKLDDKWVLIISTHIGHTTGTVMYFVGRYENHKFIPETEGVLDSGYHYASLSHEDEQGRRILLAWLREGRSVEQQLKAEWSGVQAVPRILTLDQHNRLCMTPVPELEQIRCVQHQITQDNLTADFLPVAGLSLDIDVTFDVDLIGVCGLEVACSADGTEKTTIYYEPSTETLRIVRGYSSISDEIDTYTQGLPHRLTDGEQLQLRILLDGSVLEVIANQRTSVTSRIYPTSESHTYLRVVNSAAVDVLNIWEMESIW